MTVLLFAAEVTVIMMEEKCLNDDCSDVVVSCFLLPRFVQTRSSSNEKT